MTDILAAADPIAAFMDALWMKAIAFVIIAGIVGLVIRALFGGFESFVTRKARERRSRGNVHQDTARSAATDATERISESALSHMQPCYGPPQGSARTESRKQVLALSSISGLQRHQTDSHI